MTRRTLPDVAATGKSDREAALRAGLRLEVITVAWMVVEAALAIGAGVVARSVLLSAFGFDSVIELASGTLLVWRLRAEASGDDLDRVERVEVTAMRVSAVLLVLLCLYVVGTTAVGLVLHVEPEKSLVGIAVSATALVVMPLLAWRKSGVNLILRSESLRADIAETATCAYMAASVVAGVVLNQLLGWWWAEYVAALVFLLWLARETKEVVEAARERRTHACCG